MGRTNLGVGMAVAGLLGGACGTEGASSSETPAGTNDQTSVSTVPSAAPASSEALSTSAPGAASDAVVSSDDSTTGAQPSAEPPTVPPLPDGWRAVDGLLNIVDSQAAAELEVLLREGSESQGSLGRSASLFYEYYPDEYDFLFFVADHSIADAVSASFEVVHRPVLVGTGEDVPVVHPDYGFTSNLRGAVGVNYPGPAAMPPLAHEVLHYWANALDSSFGFGVGLNEDYGAHWGYASINGQLGGFDADTLRCETPANELPPNCTASEDGRTRYVTSAFAPNTNSFKGALYAPLELYLMGLLPLAEVPEKYLVLEQAALDAEQLDIEADRAVVEADGMREVLLSDIVALHGERELLPEDKRAYTSAFVVVSAQPASDEFLQTVNKWVKVFGKRADEQTTWKSFEQTAGGLATLSTVLGRRRTADDPFPEPDMTPDGVFTSCDLVQQDCADGGACVGDAEPYCIVPGSIADGEKCSRLEDCMRGSACQADYTTEDEFRCTPYCAHLDDQATNACATLCPNNYVVISDSETFEEVAAYCVPGAGGACDPLAPQCNAEQGCYGRDTPGCALAGDTPAGEACAPIGFPCVPGAECIGAEGGATVCMPYCDLTGETNPDLACSVLCAAGAFEFEGFGVCVPPAG